MFTKFFDYKVVSDNKSNFIYYLKNLIISNKNSSKIWIACLNPHSYYLAKSDKLFKESLLNADYLIPDGIGIFIAGNILDNNFQERITGFDLFQGINQIYNSFENSSVYFLGSTQFTLDSIIDRFSKDYPNIKIAGSFSPPFKSLFDDNDLEIMINDINRVSPEILWVGLSAPKQEKFIYSCFDELNVSFVGAVGAVFDYYAGSVYRSSPVFNKFGVEWLIRLLQQPTRLWRRTFISAPIFLFDVFKKYFKI